MYTMSGCSFNTRGIMCETGMRRRVSHIDATLFFAPVHEIAENAEASPHDIWYSASRVAKSI